MKIVIADSSELVTVGIEATLNKEPMTEVLACVKNNKDLLKAIKSKDDILVIIDYTANGFNIDVIPKVLQKNPNAKILAITPEQSAQTLVDALKSGVLSYVKKDCDLGEIVDAVRETARGNKFFCGQILETIRKAAINVDDASLNEFTCAPVMLSDRETEVLKLIAEGMTNAQIAEQLFLSNHTVNTHRKNIMGKLGVKNTAGIVMYAVKAHLISPNKFLFSGTSE